MLLMYLPPLAGTRFSGAGAWDISCSSLPADTRLLAPFAAGG